MKVCFVSPRLYLYLSSNSERPAGGAQRQQSMISTALANRGYEVWAIVADYGQRVRERHEGVDLVKGVPERISGPQSVVSSLYGLTRAMYIASPDIYLVRGAPRLATATYSLSRLFRKRFVFRVANDADVDPSYLKSRYPQLLIHLYRIAISHAEAVIAQTQRQRQLLREHFNVEASLVPNGYDLPPPSKILSHEKREHVLWVGSSDPERKNPRLFVQLASQLPDLEFTMISQPIAGDEDFHNDLREAAESVENINFTGPVAPDAIHDYYRTAMLLVNTSDYEGFPNTFLEAWRFETPTLSLYFDLDELLENEVGGIRASSIENLAAITEELASNDSRRAELGADGRSYMKENYSLSKVVNRYQKAFEGALK